MKVVRRVVTWIGGALALFGVVTVGWSVIVIIQYKTGWGLTPLQRCCDDDWGRAALAGILSGMFFILVGAGALLVSRFPHTTVEEERDQPSPRWTMPVVVLLFVSGIGSIVLATVFAGMTDEFGDAAVGIVTYCMLMGVGLLFAAWGLKRARDSRELPPG